MIRACCNAHRSKTTGPLCGEDFGCKLNAERILKTPFTPKYLWQSNLAKSPRSEDEILLGVEPVHQGCRHVMECISIAHCD